MLRRGLLVTPFFLFGCASTRTSPVIVDDAVSVSGTEAARVETLTVPDLASGGLTDFAPDPQLPTPMPTPRRRERLILKGGYYGSSEDGLDDGYMINVSWMRPTSDVFASEVEIGYLDASGSDNAVDRDVWSIPLIVNGRVTVPLGQKLEIYGGLGLGSFYYEADAKTSGVNASANGFLFGGDAFFGGALHIGQTLWIGVEDKYYVTDSASELGGGLDANVVMLTLGFDR